MVILSRLTPGYYNEQAVLAFEEAGWDPRFCTTLCAGGRDPAARLLRLAGVSRRGLKTVDASRLRTRPWREVVRLLTGRLTRNEVVNDAVFQWMRDGFDAWVASQMCPPVRMVYGYETECLETFRAARKAGIVTVLDLPSPEHDFVENLLWEECSKFPELMTPARRRFRELQAQRTARRHEEFRLANAVVANSSLTAHSWASAGLDGSKIQVVTYGAPDPVTAGADGGSRGGGPLRLIWAGTFSTRKGAHYLLEAWRKWNPGAQAQLDVYGVPRLPGALLAAVPEGIRLHGSVPRDHLLDEFLAADLLVFPTLCDGFGLVVTEALSRGLPVLTTRQAGASDLIRDRANGLVVESRDAAQLETALDWALGHRDELRAMRGEALRTAQACQWADYRRNLRAALDPFMQASR